MRFFLGNSIKRGESNMSNLLIVVDMLNDFVHKDGTLQFPFARGIVPFVKERVDTHRKKGNQVIYLCDAHDEDDLEFERFPKHAVINTWGSSIIDELNTTDKDIFVPKKRYSGFYGTSLAEELRIYGPKKVEVVGVCTSICVMDTVGGLANRDYKVIVPVKGVADFDNDAHKAALDRMKSLYGAEIKE